MTILVIIGAVVLTVQAIVGLAFLISSICEKETRASLFAAAQFALMLVVLALYLLIADSGFFETYLGGALLILGLLAGAAASYYLARRTEPNQAALQGGEGQIVGEVTQYDERCMVFARNKLQEGTEPYRQFYEKHPELEEVDRQRRKIGGVLGKFGRVDIPHERPNIAAMMSNRSIPHVLSDPAVINPKPTPWYGDTKAEMSPEEATMRVKGYVKYLGAELVGIARVNPLWMYSHRGQVYASRWETLDFDWSKWGEEIHDDHPYAVVFAEEMKRDMVDSAPHTPSVVESMKNYAKGAVISAQLAAYIANLGYSATANHVQHYTGILPALAVDAGLGELSRMGYLLSKELGPRLRLSAVTTNLPLVPDKPVDIGVADFCRICKKCSDCCPSSSIPGEDDPQEHNGTLRYKLNAETCFEYWAKAGTDCCVCMRVCPWSHARTWPHRLIVWLISRNQQSRRLFNFMDNLFYGRRPKPKAGPAWASYRGR